MEIRIITDYHDMPEFEADNVFQTREWMSLYAGEKETQAVMFAACDGGRVVMAQPVVIQRYIRRVPRKFGSYAVAWYEPWRDESLDDVAAIDAFCLLKKEMVKYCRSRAVYLEFRHFAEENVYDSVLNGFKRIEWYNIRQRVAEGDEVRNIIGRDKRNRVSSSEKNGVIIINHPTREQWREWYELLLDLYKRIRRPLPSWNVIDRARQCDMCEAAVAIKDGRLIGGSIVLKLGNVRYEWYRAAIDDVEGAHPSVMLVYAALQRLADNGGGMFDYMGAGRRDREYGVRTFKLKFGGNLVREFRYRKWMFL